MKESYYFSHDYNATQDPKMIELLGECGLEGVGFYWILIEHLHSDPTSKINSVQLKTLLKMYGGFHGGEQVFNKIQQVLNTTGLLLKDENGYFYSSRVIQHKKERQQLSEKRSFAGKKSAEARQNPTRVQQYKGKERKGKEKIGEERGATTATEIRKTLRLPDTFPVDQIIAVLEKYPKVDVAAVAMKVAGRYSGKPYSQLWTTFVTWCGTEKGRSDEGKKETMEDKIKKYNKL